MFCVRSRTTTLRRLGSPSYSSQTFQQLARIEERPNKGRCVVAETDIPADSIIVRHLCFFSDLQRAPAYSKVVHYRTNDEYCAHCHQPLKGIDRKTYHSRFTRSHYGSAYCRDIFDHLEKCLRVPLMSVALMVAQELDSVEADDPYLLGNWTQDELDLLQLMIATLGRRHVDLEGGDPRWSRQFYCMDEKMKTHTVDPLTWDDVKKLHANKQNLIADAQFVEKCHRISDVLKDIIQPKLMVSQDELFDLMCIIKNNAVSIRWATETLGGDDDEEEEEDLAAVEFFSSGLGLFPHAAFFNHSCTPNAECYFDTFTNLVITTIKPVKKDEEITISYIDLPYTSSSYDRQQACKEAIWTQYRFDCACE